MPLQNDAVPTKTEVASQLERILSSSAFAAAPQQGRLLRFVVEHANAGNTINGKGITSEMFPSVDPDASNVRTSASFVRRRLNDYYKGPGCDDLVRIELPPGPGYRAKFTYHQKSKAIAWFRKGAALRSSGSVESLAFANNAFSKAIAIDPGYVAAHAARAEVELLEFLAGHVVGILPMNPQRTWFSDPQERLSTWKFDAEVWLLHAVVGMESLLRGDKDRAKQAFAFAMKVDAEQTGRSVWYAAYLLLIGREREALSIARALANEQPESIWAVIVYGLFLYITRDFEQADAVLGEMVTFDQAEVFHDLVRGLVRLSLGQWKSALKLFENASVIRREEWSFLKNERGYALPEAERFPGLIILALAKDGNIGTAAKRFELLKKQRFVKPFQMAIAHLGMGEEDETGRLLTHACKYGDMLALWLRLWPVFDLGRHRSPIERLLENRKARF